MFLQAIFTWVCLCSGPEPLDLHGRSLYTNLVRHDQKDRVVACMRIPDPSLSSDFSAQDTPHGCTCRCTDIYLLPLEDTSILDISVVNWQLSRGPQSCKSPQHRQSWIAHVKSDRQPGRMLLNHSSMLALSYVIKQFTRPCSRASNSLLEWLLL